MATPERWPRKLSAVRSAVRIERSGPSTVATTGRRRRPRRRRPASQVTSSAGSTWAKASTAQARPATTPVGPAHHVDRGPAVGRHQRRRSGRPRGSEVLGEGPGHGLDHRRPGRVEDRRPVLAAGRSRRTRRRSPGRPVAVTVRRPGTAGRAGGRVRTSTVAVRRRGRCGSARRPTARGSRCGRGPRGSRCAAWPSSRTLRAAVDQVGQLAVGPVRRGRAARPRPATVATVRPARASESALRTTPAPSVMARCSRSRVLATSGQAAGRRRRAARPRHRSGGSPPAPPARTRSVQERRQHARSAVGPSPPVEDGLGQPGAEDHALEQRVGGQPVGPVDPGAGHLARRPQAGQGGGPPQVGQHAARQVVGGRGDGQPVGRRDRGRWPPARR